MGKKKKQEKQDKQDKQEKLKKSKQKAQKSAKHDKHAKTGQREKDSIAKEEKAALRDANAAAAKQSGEKPKDRTPRKAAPAPGKSKVQPDMAAVFRAFGDAHRQQILDLLKEQELSAGELLDSLDIVQSTLSHHMKLLVEAGIVKCRKKGKWSYYSIDRDKLVQVSEYILKWS